MLNPVVIAIPLFALMIALEAFFAARAHSDIYDKKDAWTNIFIGFASVAFNFVFGLLFGVIYVMAYAIAPYHFPADAWWTWALLFFIDDFAYYWFHR
ncbi:MAG TPA: hypothetical protein VK468_09960, partial [Pyrinomonadaceae bacterium]|nr:hypothetical protein [Pyrinomonadaceae bacterium]